MLISLSDLQAVRLTPLQVEQVLIWREEHLRNMLAIYEQRQHMNMEVLVLCTFSFLDTVSFSVIACHSQRKDGCS